MCLQGCSPNEHSFTFLFSACASLSSHQQGRMLHTHFVKSGFGCDVFALTALVDMYAKLGLLSLARKQFDEMTVRDVPTWNSMIAGYARCGDLEGALELFRLMPARNVTSWTAMISGYAQNGQYAKALSMFLMMEEETEMRPNEVTLASVLPACANLGALEVGERIEVYARGNGYFKNLRNLCSWNSMIMGLAVHGRCDEAIELFYKMLREGAAPDDVTFVGVLLACTHGGMVVEGQHFFESMERDFSIAPKLEHYGCMVDLLGRAGELREAHDLILRMPMEPDSVAAGALFELEPSNPGNYVILSNIYATAGRWDGVARLRKLMKGGKITKAAGYSFIEEGGHIHKFIVEDRSHSRSDEIYALLDEVSMKMKLHGNVNDSDSEIETACLMV
ncbi:Pentatricopeptide repeat-containing protein [Vitis vinifera]|uniref:Pentatricopeptide repeat-containing protein n=1 Tax=Vitis vinifera TaxID=29760 RepID=A0A438IFA8_VITVI|nr:Pentatricopeptide repeat-containing protein [Vitis vinifera]